MQSQWLIWRLVMAEKATFAEIETHWSLLDVYRATMALDFQMALEHAAVPKTTSGKRR